jgi:dihydrofolate synthase / folylpolyglutamate synthase
MATYAQVIDRLYQATSSLGVKPTQHNARAFDQALNFPTASYPTIHVSGSNGKGSVTTKIAKALELSGYRVGLYTSPHLFSFRERITVNSGLIDEDCVVEGMEKIFSIDQRLRLDATFFEMATFLCFDYFRKMQVDVAVIETGLGGRLDATNIIHPVLTVITSISREHTQILGDDLEQIALEKAGILKENVPVILGPKARCQAIYDRAKALNCSVIASKKISYFYDEENNAVAELALQRLAPDFILDRAAIEQGLAIRPPCRFERNEAREVIFDVAHNPEAVFYLLQALHTFFPQGRFRFLVGFSKDKKYDQCLELIADVAIHIHLVQAATPRAATAQELRSVLKNEDPTFSTVHDSVTEGVTQAYARGLARKEILVICGSFYIMAEAKEALQFPDDSLDLNKKIFPRTLSSSVT